MAFDVAAYLAAVASNLERLADADPERVEVYSALDEALGGNSFGDFLSYLEHSGGAEWLPRLQTSVDALEPMLRHFQGQYQPMGPSSNYNHDDDREEMVVAWERCSERIRWFKALIQRAATFEVWQKTEMQLAILRLLIGSAMTAKELTDALHCSKGTLFGNRTPKNPEGRGGLNELMQFGLVIRDVKVGGYYRPDRPPDLNTV